MLETKVHKEITEYDGKIMFGMTGRQIICVLIAIAIDIPLFFLLYKKIGIETTGYICFFVAIPVLAVGFLKYKGTPIPELVKLLINYYKNNSKLRCVNDIATDYIVKGVNDSADRRVRNNRKTARKLEYECFCYTAGNKTQLRAKRKENRKQLAAYKKQYVLQQKESTTARLQ